MAEWEEQKKAEPELPVFQKTTIGNIYDARQFTKTQFCEEYYRGRLQRRVRERNQGIERSRSRSPGAKANGQEEEKKGGKKNVLGKVIDSLGAISPFGKSNKSAAAQSK